MEPACRNGHNFARQLAMPALQHVILPDNGASLIRQELAIAFQREGMRVSRVDPKILAEAGHENSLAALLEGTEGALFLSINFQGLGNLKATLALLEQHNAAVAVWCVDNPWNLLAGVRDPRWRSLPLFVTDKSFIGPLKQCGATKVEHLPLAACPASFGPNAQRDAAFPAPKNLAPLIFVGHSAFPGKDAFFAGTTLDTAVLEKAKSLLEQGVRPDLTWWETQLACSPETFWPGKKARVPALGAEESNFAWRRLCLHHAAVAGKELHDTESDADASACLTILGDAGWQKDLPPHAELRKPVDYYAHLPAIYRKARYNLTITSLQLPQGLNQRHFDTWLAGGFCLTDNTPGLTLFPQELTRPITFSKARDIPTLVNRLEGCPAQRKALQHDWQQHILQFHTYQHRVISLLTFKVIEIYKTL